MCNYYDIDVKQKDGLFKTVRKNVSHLSGSKEVLKLRKQGNEARLCYGFHQYKIMSQNEIDFREGATITKDNIHLYYEFMSDEDLEKHKILIDNILVSRFCTVSGDIDLLPNYIPTNNTYSKCRHYLFYSVIFGVKDTLKPIDEYIEEIKESSEYKEYIKSKGV